MMLAYIGELEAFRGSIIDRLQGHVVKLRIKRCNKSMRAKLFHLKGASKCNSMSGLVMEAGYLRFKNKVDNRRII